MVEEHRNHHGKYFHTLIITSILLVTLCITTNEAFAMGQPPSTCPNRYDGPITSFIINNGSQTFDAIANPGVTFNVNSPSGYSVTFVIHTPSTSSQGNSNPGTTWYRTTAPGFANGVCVNGVGPNQNVTISGGYSHPGNFGPAGSQSVEFSTASTPYATVTYHVNWVAVPTAPANLSAKGFIPSQINLHWDAAYGYGSAITNYKIYRSTGSGTETLLTTVGNVLSYNDTQVTNGITYFYRVTAVNSVGEGPVSNEASASPASPNATPPQPPTGLTATAVSSYQINLSWQAPSNTGGADLMGYKIERSNDGGSTWNNIISNTGNSATTYSDTGLQPVTSYTYRVSAVNYAGTSSPSNTATATTLTVLVGEWKFEGNTLDTSGYGNNGVNNGATFVQGKIGQALSFDGVSNVVSVPNSPSLNFGTSGSFTISTWMKSTQSGFGVIVDDRRNNDGVYAGYSIEDNSGTLTARIRDNSAHDVAVVATKNVNDGIFHHIVFVIDRSTQTEKIYLDNTLQATASISNVGDTNTLYFLTFGGDTSPNTLVNFFSGTIDQIRIYSKALSQQEIQTLFNEGSSSTQTVPSAPQPPTGLTATAMSSSQINLSWTAPANNGGSAITGYKIERSTDSGTTWSTVQSNTASTSTTYSDTGLTASTTYMYRISAINSVGTSSPSNTASATTSGTSTTQVTISIKSVNLSGNPITGMSTVIRYTNGTTISESFTPVSFTVKSGTTYVVHVRNYQTNVFNHWMDGSTNSYYTITPTQNVVLTAYYSTS